ncbi:MAG: hypothetical protein ACP5E2_08430 [Terracidiphilus sp.]
MRARCIFAVALGLLAAGACFGQDGSAPVPLRILDETPMPSNLIQTPYLRVYPGGTSDGREFFYVQTAPGKFATVGFDGTSHTALDVSLVPSSGAMNPKDLFVVDLSGDPRGGVIAPVVWNPNPGTTQAGLLRFDQDGDFRDLIWLDTNADFTPTHAAAFSSGQGFLVAGYDEHGILVSLFDYQGKKVRTIALPGVGGVEAAKSPPKQEQHRPGTSAPQSSVRIAFARSASFIEMASSEDNAVYVFNPSSGRSLFRIRPEGQYTEIKLAQPQAEKGANTMPLGLFVSHSNIYLDEAILGAGQKASDYIGQLKRFLISVYSQNDGALEQSFLDDTGFGALPVSLSPREFYFLKMKDNEGGMPTFSLIRVGR